MHSLHMVFAVIALAFAGVVEASHPRPMTGADGDRHAEPVSIRQAVFRIRGDQPTRIRSLPTSASAYLGNAPQDASDSLASLVHSDGRLSILSGLIRRSGLVWPRPAARGTTLLAPSNEALSFIHPGVLERLARDRVALEVFLDGHSIDGALDRAALQARAALLTRGWQAVDIEGSGGLTLNRLSKVRDTLPARDGVIHLIDRPLAHQSGPAADTR